jgi:hypothetical protein
MNRKIVISGLGILASLALVGVGVYAAFATSAAANGSTFSSGNPLLHISADNGADAPSGYGISTAGFSVPGLLPGIPKTFKFWLYNAGTADDGALSLTALFTDPSGTGAGSPNKLEVDLHVSLSCAGVGTVADDIFYNYEGTGKPIVSGTLAPLTQTQCTMTALLPSGNTLDKGQVLNYNAVFGGSTGL